MKINVTMKLLCVLFLCLNFKVNAQQRHDSIDLKQTILKDLMLLNRINESAIIDMNTIFKFEDEKGITTQYPYSDIENYSDHFVIIHKIDTFENYCNIYVSLRVAFKEYGLRDDTLLYTICYYNNNLYKINGFVTSDILQLSDKEVNNMDPELIQVSNYPKFKKLLKQKSYNVDRYLSISVLRQLNLKYKIPCFYFPLLRSSSQIGEMGFR